MPLRQGPNASTTKETTRYLLSRGVTPCSPGTKLRPVTFAARMTFGAIVGDELGDEPRRTTVATAGTEGLDEAQAPW